MTIASELTKLNTNLTNSYTAVSDKGGTLPQVQNFDNLATAISSISSGGGSTNKGINYATLLNDCVVTLVKGGNISYESSGFLRGYTNFMSENSGTYIYPNDEIVNGSGAAFSLTGCEYIKTITFGAVDNIFMPYTRMFAGFTQLTDIYFSALKTTSNISLTDLLSNSGTNVIHTLHFPSNLESKIQSLGGYPLFGGTSGYVVCAFDLPATS